MPPMPRILICQCSNAEVFPREMSRRLLEAVSRSGHAFETVADLCVLAARRDPLLKKSARGGDLKIAACYPRSVQWLFAAADAPLDSTRTQIFNLRAESPDAVVPGLLDQKLTPNLPVRHSSPEPSRNPAQKAELAAEQESVVKDGFRGWFPVIDFDRCTQCMECLGFCLFGVFGIGEAGRLEVQAPESCKNNCPACARVCPEAAIIFPKFKSGPISGQFIDNNPEREKIKVDISALLGGDIYARLRTRNTLARARFSTERDPDEAREQRRRCLAKLAELGQIPPEVLASLPSPDELRQRAETAQAKLRSLKETDERP